MECFSKIEDIPESSKDGKKPGVAIFHEINYLDRCLSKCTKMDVKYSYVNIFQFLCKPESCGAWKLCLIHRDSINTFHVFHKT